MNIEEFFKLGVEMGISADPRSEESIEKILKETKKSFEKMDASKKEYFDLDDLSNVYYDSAIYHNNGNEIKKIFVGIDTEVQELILADKLGADTILGHHPEGKALLKLWKVLDIHTEALINAGINVNIAEKLVAERKSELARGLHGLNYNRSVDAAKLLDLSFFNLHTVADNLANKYFFNFLKGFEAKSLKEIVEASYKIEEYQIAAKNQVIPKIVSGDENSRVGNYFVKFNGGTSGNKKIFKYLENRGISTFICMHLPENQIKEAKEHNINVIIMPHMASDSLGMNILLDGILFNNHEIEIISGSGFTRVDRRS